jgi:pimeloyl-ACP methyl ester carboxylesterase
MPIFILVPGAWHGAWCWERVMPLLEAAGAVALAPELAGMGADQANPPPAPTLAVWATQIAALAQAQPEPVILVGHSRGGLVISQAAEHAPDAVAGLIYLAALLTPDGVSMQQAIREAALMQHFALTVAPDGASSTLDPARVPTRFYNTSEPAWAQRAAARLSPEPADVASTPPQLTAGRHGRLPRAYIRCTQDRVVVPAMQDWLLAQMPCDPVFELPTDHSPFYSAPAALAELLLTCAAAWKVA